MTAVERLAAALEAKGALFPSLVAQLILAADEWLAQDMEDGRALRELREACQDVEPYRAWFEVGYSLPMVERHWTVRVERHTGDQREMAFRAPTIAEAADACRMALEARS